MARRKTQTELDILLEEIKEKVTRNFSTDAIVLFGSYAKGTATEYSDIDVAVVSPDFNYDSPMCDNSFLVTKTTKLYDPDLQILAFNSDKYFNETYIDPNFIKEIKRTGKIIWSKANTPKLALRDERHDKSH
jgi:predicted nucleotidyltransferase